MDFKSRLKAIANPIRGLFQKLSGAEPEPTPLEQMIAEEVPFRFHRMHVCWWAGISLKTDEAITMISGAQFDQRSKEQITQAAYKVSQDDMADGFARLILAINRMKIPLEKKSSKTL